MAQTVASKEIELLYRWECFVCDYKTPYWSSNDVSEQEKMNALSTEHYMNTKPNPSGHGLQRKTWISIETLNSLSVSKLTEFLSRCYQ